MNNSDQPYLIIDDSEIDRIITSRLLKVRLGATEMFFAENGSKALELIALQQQHFQKSLVILLDIQMPVMDGFQFLEAFEKMDAKLKDVTRVFMLSATLDPDDMERAQRHNFVASMMGKPLLIDDFIGLLGAR